MFVILKLKTMGAPTRTWGDIHQWIINVAKSCTTMEQIDGAFNLSKLFNKRFTGIISEAKMDKLIDEQLHAINNRSHAILHNFYFK